MRTIDYHKVGEVFEYEGVLLKVVRDEFIEKDVCSYCYFQMLDDCDSMRCMYHSREDETDVIYVSFLMEDKDV